MEYLSQGGWDRFIVSKVISMSSVRLFKQEYLLSTETSGGFLFYIN